MAEDENRNRLGEILVHINKSNEEEKDILEYPEAVCILNHIKKKIKKKRDYKTLFSGGTGSGKSYAGLRLLELWYTAHFNEPFPLDHIFSNLSEAVLKTKEFKRKGEGVLIEEISASAGSRDSATTQNKLWNKFLDTCRIKQIVIVMNCPHLSFADKHIRMSLDSWVDCKGVDFKKKVVMGRPLWLQTSPHKPEPYKHKFETEDGASIGQVYFRKPSKYILEVYDKGKSEFTEELYDEIYLKMSADRKKKLKEIGAKFLTTKELETYNLYLSGYTTKEGAEKRGVVPRVFRLQLKSAKEKLKTPEYRHQCKLLEKKGEGTDKGEKGGRS